MYVFWFVLVYRIILERVLFLFVDDNRDEDSVMEDMDGFRGAHDSDTEMP